MKTSRPKVTKCALSSKKYIFEPVFKLTVCQVASVAAFAFFYAALVIWPSQDEVLQLEEPSWHRELRNPQIRELMYDIIRKIRDTGTRCSPSVYSNFTINIIDNAKSIIGTTKEPVIVWWTDRQPWIEDRYCPSGATCKVFRSPLEINEGAYLFYASDLNFTKLPLPRRSQNIIWGLLHEESPRNVPELMYDKGLNLFNFSSTFSRYSDVPIPLHHLESLEKITSKAYYFVETTRKNFYLLNGLAPLLYIQTDCSTSTERDDYVKELSKYTNIDSYGSCLNNKRLPDFKFGKDYLNNLKNDKFLKFVARYKFTIAIENGVCNDYITEKFWRALRVGSVPIYFGSPTIRDWLPNNKSAILLEDYCTPKALSEHLKKLLADDKLYEEYLEHKTKGIITNQRIITELKVRPYQTKYFDLINTFECFICEKLHSRKRNTNMNIVNRSHYDCPKPISALSLQVNPLNIWVHHWEFFKRQADEIYDLVFGVK